MSVEKIISKSVNKNPLGLKEALAEELRARVAAALEEKMQEESEQLDEVLMKDSDALYNARETAKKHLAAMEKHEHKDHDKFVTAYERHKSAVARMRKLGAHEQEIKDVSKRNRDK